MRFSFEYPDIPHEPIWGRPSSKANFCEEDYAVTSYFAEFVNTLTNGTYVIYAVYGLRKNWRHQNAFLHCLPYIGLAGVGICSWYFHMVLNYHAQMSDDLSMLFNTGIVLHRIFTFSSNTSWTLILSAALTLSLAGVSWYHVTTNEILIHTVTFALMINVIGLKTRALVHDRIPNRSVRRRVRRLARGGAVSFISGFAIWVVDRIFCNYLIRARRAIGMPWGFLLELHGWWHVLTGIGAYVFIALVEYLTSDDVGKDPAGLYAWPADLILPLMAEEDGRVTETSRTKRSEPMKIAVNHKDE